MIEETHRLFSGLSGDALITQIREERRKELCYEGQRWFDCTSIWYAFHTAQMGRQKVYTLTKTISFIRITYSYRSVAKRNLLLEQNRSDRNGLEFLLQNNYKYKK